MATNETDKIRQSSVRQPSTYKTQTTWQPVGRMKCEKQRAKLSKILELDLGTAALSALTLCHVEIKTISSLSLVGQADSAISAII